MRGRAFFAYCAAHGPICGACERDESVWSSNSLCPICFGLLGDSPASAAALASDPTGRSPATPARHGPARGASRPPLEVRIDPPSWRREVALVWSPTGDAECPYEAHVEAQRWRVRVGDFPAEALYTLLVDGAETERFDAWPACWRRP